MKVKILKGAALALCAILAGAQAPAIAAEDAPAAAKKLKLAGDLRDVPIESLLKQASDYAGMNFIYQPNQVAQRVTFQFPAEGVELDGDGVVKLLADALEQYRLGIVEGTPGTWSVVQATEIITSAPIVDAETAKKTAAWKWVTCKITLAQGDANAYRAALQNLVARHGGAVNPVPGAQALLICDRADRIVQLIETVEGWEKELAAREVKTYDLPEGIDGNAAASTVMQLLRPDYSVSASLVAKANKIMVRAKAEQHAAIADIIKKYSENIAAAEMAMKLEVYNLNTDKKPADVAASLTKLFGADATFAAVPDEKAIIVRARAAKHEEIKKAIELIK